MYSIIVDVLHTFLYCKRGQDVFTGGAFRIHRACVSICQKWLYHSTVRGTALPQTTTYNYQSSGVFSLNSSSSHIQEYRNICMHGNRS